MEPRIKELTRLLCKWNRKEISERDFAVKVWFLFNKEALETWNDPLESLLIDSPPTP
jgi:hypothetical protein